MELACRDEEDLPLCNLYSVTKGQQAIREFTGAMRDRTGNMSPLPSIFPDYFPLDQPLVVLIVQDGTDETCDRSLIREYADDLVPQFDLASQMEANSPSD